MSVDVHMPAGLQPPEATSVGHYRPLSLMAVASLALVVFSLAAFIDRSLAVIPSIGMTLGLIAWQRVRMRPDELAGARVALVGVIANAVILLGSWFALAYVEAREIPPGALPVSYDDLQPPEGASEGTISERSKFYDGQRVFLRGYAFPSRHTTGIRKFVLVRDNQQCCFGGKPLLTDMVEVTLSGDRTWDYSNHLLRVAGVFHVAPGQGVDGLPKAVYQLDADYLE